MIGCGLCNSWLFKKHGMNAAISLPFSLQKCKISTMKEKSARKHRSKPLLQKTSRRIGNFIPRETDTDIRNANPTQREIASTSSMGPIGKQKQLSPTLESEKGL